MSRYFLCLAVLAAVLLPSSAFSQVQTIFSPDVTVTLYGTLTITAQQGVNLPGALFIVLYRTDKSVFGRLPVTNHGTYQFFKVNNGDWEIVIEAESSELVRIPFQINFTRNTELRKDLELEWREKPSSTSPRRGAISAKDIYTRRPENETLMNQALAANGKKNYGEAVKLLKKVVDSDVKDFEAWTELGTVLFTQGNRSEAEKAFKRALEERPSYPVALLNFGKLQFDQKDYEASIQTLSQLISAHPESAEAHRFLGEAYLQIKKGSKAVPELEEAARLDPEGQAEAHLSMAALYDVVGLKDRAAAEYEKFLAAKPNYADKEKLQKYIQENKKL
jgi:tetratricopeptide (TPR) repeat protein